MCDYSSFSSIDKFPFPCAARSGAAVPAPHAPSVPAPAPAAPGTAREPPARRQPRSAAIWSSQRITGGHFNNKEAKVNCFFSE